MHNFPESQSVPAADHAEASSGALSDRVFEAGPPGVEAGSCGPISATSTKRPLEAVPPKSAQTVGGQPEKKAVATPSAGAVRDPAGRAARSPCAGGAERSRQGVSEARRDRGAGSLSSAVPAGSLSRTLLRGYAVPGFAPYCGPGGAPVPKPLADRFGTPPVGALDWSPV